VAPPGDEQYQNGYYQDFENSFNKYWGAFKFLQRPAPGNHEFYDNHGQAGVRGYGYFDYYNGIEHNAADGSELDTTLSTGVTQPTPQPDGIVVLQRDGVAGPGPEPEPRPLHPRLLAPADVQLDREPDDLGQQRGEGCRRLVAAPVPAPRHADPQRA
jgi:hypothetical protein